MRVGLNLVFLVPGETGGMETYARELIVRLAAVPGLELTAFVNREAAAVAGPWRDVPAVVVPVEARSRVGWVLGEQRHLPRLAARAGVEVVHSLASTGPVWGAFRRVTTVQDVTYRVVPEAHGGLRTLGMRVLVPGAARRSDRVIVTSRATAADVGRFIGVPGERIDLVPLGVGFSPVAPALGPAETRARFGLGDRPVALCVSAKRPHKNLGRLVAALGRIAPERRPVLVLTGYPTPWEDELRARAAALGLEADVRILGWVPEPELEALYAVAACFAFPSLYEGFGLPVLEAMARGVPVACSGRGGLADAAGDAALVFDPEDEGAIAAAIERLLGDPALAGRLRAAGRAHAAGFSWERCAAGTVASYRRALASPAP